MAANINDFRSSFTSELARSSRFEVNIAPFGNLSSNDILFVPFSCENAQIPGRNFLTTEQRTYGPSQKFPYQTDYGDVQLTFIVDGKLLVRNFFDTWMDLVNPSLNNGSRYFNVNYKDNYSTTITITQYNLQNQPCYETQLYNAFPVNMNQLDLDWSSESIHKLVVSFAYDYWWSRTITSS